MGVFSRRDSPWWWLWLETTKQKERTAIRIGETAAHRRDSRRLAEDRYHQRMNELAARLYKLPSAQPAIRFAAYAALYEPTISLHKGARRERELLKPLVAWFGERVLSTIDADAVKAYMAQRRTIVSAVTVNREVDLLKAMLRDAAPKYLNASPIAGLKRLPTIAPRRRLLTTQEERRLLAACEDPEDRAILILGIDTMMRLGDLLDLEQSHRSGVWLYVQDPKSGTAYEVALTKRAVRAITAIRSERYLFPKFRRALNPRDWPSAVRQRLEYLCRNADVPYGKKQGGITFHWATRRTGATRLLMAKRVPVPVVQKQGNWKTPDVLLAIYADAHRNDQLAAVGQFPENRRKRARARRKSA